MFVNARAFWFFFRNRLVLILIKIQILFLKANLDCKFLDGYINRLLLVSLQSRNEKKERRSEGSPESLFLKRSIESMESVIFFSIANRSILLSSCTETTALRKYRAHFGISLDVTSILWMLLAPNSRIGTEPKHLLWELFFLKTYGTENVGTVFWKCDEKTFRKWVWYIIEKISNLSIIRWKDRLRASVSSIDTCFCSVDGTDCRIQEPTLFNPDWFSHKFHGPGVRYEVGISINDGNIVWVHGPFLSGSWPDVKIFKSKLAKVLRDGKNVVADKGYQHVRCITPYNVSDPQKELHARVRARHEACNARLKCFNVLNYEFRHNVKLHGQVLLVLLLAVAKLVTLAIRYENLLFKL